ncbi:MAG: hypothetical protein ABJF11_01750 [Reichenbachiella sp.]|uniref:hypothetical protein n=1 Tax=Reichenbachiella sp. TaxID=2184521 RepID=UPI00326389FC
MQEKRHISNFEIATIYFKTPPHLFSEILLSIGVFGIIIFLGSRNIEALALLISPAIGYFLVKKKVRITKNSILAIRYGDKTTATISEIQDTNFEHNGRTVKKYIFKYTADHKQLSFSFQSAYKRSLNAGDEFSIFYLSENPEIACIPTLYSIYKY